MHCYDAIREKHSRKVCQTIDSPILVFDYFQLSEVMVALVAMMFFGVVLYSWPMVFLSLVVILGGLPVLRRHYPKGILLHLPHRYLGMSLPGLITPNATGLYSD